jgi:heat shock protein HtpX
MKRIVLFLATNLAVMLVLGVVLNVLGVNRFIGQYGLNIPMLLVFSVIVGFTGAIISLLMSKPMAKWSTGAHVIVNPRSSDEQWLVSTVKRLSDKAGIGMPEVAVYDGEPNAFATGAFKNSSLVAVSNGLLASMTKEEVEAVLAHEVAHIANGDMVTMTLIQGVLNTFVVFLSKVVGYFVDRVVLKNDRDAPGIGYYVTDIACQIVFGVLASIIVAWFSRWREYRADAGASTLMGTQRPMVAALQRLGGLEPGELPKSIQAAGISDKPGFMALFSSHPPIQARVAALQDWRPGQQ